MAEPYDSQTFYCDFNATDQLNGRDADDELVTATEWNGSAVTWGSDYGLFGTCGVRIEPSGRLGYPSENNLHKPEATVMFWLKPNWWIPDPTSKSKNPSGKGLEYAIPFEEICSGVDEPYCRWKMVGVGAAQSGHPQLQRFLNDDGAGNDNLAGAGEDFLSYP